MGWWGTLVVAAVVARTPSLEVHLADLDPEIRAQLATLEAADPNVLLEAVQRLEPPYHFDVGTLAVETDRRWYQTPQVTGPGQPLLDLRRWPGDTALVCYGVPAGAPPPPGAFEACPQRGSWRCRRGQLETAAGSRPAVWAVRTHDGVALGCLLVPGDAGLGEGAVAALEEELWFLLLRMEIRWETLASLVAGGRRAPLAVPDLGFPPGAADERRDPWQVVRGFDFTLGLPPGLRSHWAHESLPVPNPVPGGRLWFRGRFRDARGREVAVGDGRRVGYVAEVEAAEAWRAGRAPPRGAPGARRVRSIAFDAAVELTRATEARAERWQESGFQGEWLIFRLALPERGVEIGIPVLAGRRSESLFWIPLTFRELDEPPAPPPVDPARQFGIEFDRLSRAARRRNPWIEGYFQAPGLRLEVPAGWWPVVQLRSRDGYPVRFVDRQGQERAILERWPRPPEPGDAWQPVEHPGRFNARAVFRRQDGAHLWIAREGHAFVLRPGQSPPDGEIWERLVAGVVLERLPRGVSRRDGG